MVHMDYLNNIVQQKRKEVDRLVQSARELPDRMFDRKMRTGNKFSEALKRPKLAVIAEIKRCSPSRGEMGKIEDPIKLALQYCLGKASAISVLTDFNQFGGNLNDLKQVSHVLKEEYPHIPTLRKDFIIHPLQLAEAAAAGASAVLLITRLLGKDLSRFIREAGTYGLETLTEVHDLDELKLALDAGAFIIGVNHRNLKTFEIDLKLSEKLRAHIPAHVITVAESGIHTPKQAQQMRDLGYDAILVGEALVTAQNPSELIMLMKGEKNEG